MSETPSTMLELGTSLPAVRLVNAVDGAELDVSAFAAGKKGAVVLFICNHCPYVVHIRAELVRVAHEALERGLAVVAKDEGWRFPFLFDRTQNVARAFHAACTPDLFVFDARARLAYRGQFDDSRPSNGKPVTGRDLRGAIEAVVAGRSPSLDQRPSVGCNIKWRRG